MVKGTRHKDIVSMQSVEPKHPVSGAIEIRVEKLAQLFHSLDPYPFRERDLDRDAEEFIVDWARELPRRQPLSILIHVPRTELEHEHAREIQAALHRYFHYRAEVATHDLRALFSNGRISLLIGMGVLLLCVLASQFATGIANSNTARFIGEGLLILGWVANWRPAEIFLYDWWPIVRRRTLLRRLSRAEVSLVPR
jgi:hypothetical protein